MVSCSKYKPHYQWSDDEYALLLWAVNKHSVEKKTKVQSFIKPNWIDVSSSIPGRNDNQCKYRYQQARQSNFKKSNWVQREDDELKRILNSFGAKNWNAIAKMLWQNLQDQDKAKIERGEIVMGQLEPRNAK